jgi:hypothetical protein
VRPSRHHRHKSEKADPPLAPLKNAGQFAQPEANELAVNAPAATLPAAASPTYHDGLMSKLAATRSRKRTQLKVDPPPALHEGSRNSLCFENRTTEPAALALKPAQMENTYSHKPESRKPLRFEIRTTDPAAIVLKPENALAENAIAENAPLANALTAGQFEQPEADPLSTPLKDVCQLAQPEVNAPNVNTLAVNAIAVIMQRASVLASLMERSLSDDELDFKIGTFALTTTIAPTPGVELSKTGEHGALLSPLSPPFVPSPALVVLLALYGRPYRRRPPSRNSMAKKYARQAQRRAGVRA